MVVLVLECRLLSHIHGNFTCTQIPIYDNISLRSS